MFVFVIGSLCFSRVATGRFDSRKIAGTHSTATVHVGKSGLLAGFGHQHEIQAPIQSGGVSEGFQDPSVEFACRRPQASAPGPRGIGRTLAQIKRRVDASLADHNYWLFSACLGIASADMSRSIFSSSLTFTVPPATVTGVMPKSRCFNMTSPR